MGIPKGVAPNYHRLIIAFLVVSVASCGGQSTATKSSPTRVSGPAIGRTTVSANPSAVATASPCAVAAQSPPLGTISADYATALVFAPDGRLFYAERSGTVRVWQNGAASIFSTVPTVTTEADGGYSERGLLGLAVSPTFVRDRLVYGFYSDRDRAHQHVIRWRDCAGTGLDPKVLVTVPSGSDCCHKGGRIAFGADGMLYVTLGDEHTSSAAQNINDVRGKVLRYRPDGSIPADNPFGPSNPVWASGLRNPFGIAVAGDGTIAISSNGPSGDANSPGTGYDTVVVSLKRGGNYQWPNCYGYSHPLATATCGNRIAPDWSSESSTVVPTGATFVDAAGPHGYGGKLALCTYNKGMSIVTPGTPHATVINGPPSCQLDVKQGPDHALYFSDAAHIYRSS